MSATRVAAGTTLATAVALLAAAAPAAAFHHVALPADGCGESAFAGGANPTAIDALREHNPAQDLPLPPITPEDDTAAEAALAHAVAQSGCGGD